jgi:hypothetical protein
MRSLRQDAESSSAFSAAMCQSDQDGRVVRDTGWDQLPEQGAEWTQNPIVNVYKMVIPAPVSAYDSGLTEPFA